LVQLGIAFEHDWYDLALPRLNDFPVLIPLLDGLQLIASSPSFLVRDVLPKLLILLSQLLSELLLLLSLPL